MYVKVFSKILDSSIWLEPDSTLRLWITLLASMNEDGFCAFACEENLGRRARLKPAHLRKALDTLSSPDHKSSDPENDGRRIERVPGGWMVLNAVKYRELATAEQIKESTRERVRRHRESKRITPEHSGLPQHHSELPRCHSESPRHDSEVSTNSSPLESVTSNGRETQEEVYVEEEVNPSPAEGNKTRSPKKKEKKKADQRFTLFVELLSKYWKFKNPDIEMPFGVADGKALNLMLAANPKMDADLFHRCLIGRAKSDVVHTAMFHKWLGSILEYAGGPLTKFKTPKSGEQTSVARAAGPSDAAEKIRRARESE